MSFRRRNAEGVTIGLSAVALAEEEGIPFES